MKRVKIYLARHGEIVKKNKKCYIGQVDLPLNEQGRAQAARLHEELVAAPISGIYCSDLTRSIATANIIRGNRVLGPVIKRELREINMGLWDGLSFQEVDRSFPGEFEKRGLDLVNYQTPGGESFAQLAGRVLPALDGILAAAGGDILIIGHAGVNRIILSKALGTSLENIFSIKQDYGCLNILLYSELGLQVEALNLTFG